MTEDEAAAVAIALASSQSDVHVLNIEPSPWVLAARREAIGLD